MFSADTKYQERFHVTVDPKLFPLKDAATPLREVVFSYIPYKRTPGDRSVPVHHPYGLLQFRLEGYGSDSSMVTPATVHLAFQRMPQCNARTQLERLALGVVRHDPRH